MRAGGQELTPKPNHLVGRKSLREEREEERPGRRSGRREDVDRWGKEDLDGGGELGDQGTGGESGCGRGEEKKTAELNP